VKVGAFGAAYRLFAETLGSAAYAWKPFWLILCLLSIVVGNIMAIQQKSLKKLFAFSSVAHSGFIALALLVPSQDAIVSYLVVYALMNLGLFALISHLENREQVFLVEDLKGMGNKKFFLSLLFALFVLGLAGIPPFAGFIVKFWILEALIKADYFWVSTVAVLGSLIGAAYYLRLLMVVFMSDELGRASNWETRDFCYLLRMIVFIGAVATLVGGLRPQFYADWILASLAIK
jgi:NADH-quinone oxidoreductase subunit N